MTFDPPLELRDGQHVTAMDGRWLLCDAHGDVIQDLTVRPGSTWAGAVDEVWNRANALLLEHLDEEQAASWRVRGFFVVAGASGTRYEVHPDIVKNPSGSWCLMPERNNVPVADVVLARKLWLEADEQGFLLASNFFPRRNGDARVYGAPVELGRRQLEEHLADAHHEHQRRVEEMHRDFQERLANEEQRYREEVEGIHLEYRRRQVVEVPQVRADIVFAGAVNCNCALGFRLETLEEAWAWLETHGGQAEVTIDRNEFPFVYEGGGRWAVPLERDARYEVNGHATDERTVQLLALAAEIRNGTLSEGQRDYLANLNCRCNIEVREEPCNTPAGVSEE